MISNSKFVIGVDFGTDSVRALLVDASNGQEVSNEVFYYTRWKQNLYCDPKINQYRQHPLDHIEGLEFVVKSVVKKSEVPPELIKSICIDTTGSSPIPINRNGVPLALTPKFSENPNAMMVLWKDHTAIEEANEINKLASSWDGEDFTKFVGGIYSSEWFWSKILHIIRADDTVKSEAYTWMEHCDYMTYLISDVKDLSKFKRSRCAAGHKAMWNKLWGGLPDKSFLNCLDTYLGDLRDRLYSETYTSDTLAGNLNSEWASKFGLSTSTTVAVGTFDAHAGAVGAGIEKHSLVKVMGTSTCDIIVVEDKELKSRLVRGICGQVDGSVIPSHFGLEAGQSAFGDVIAWFKNLFFYPFEKFLNESSLISEKQKSLILDETSRKFIDSIAKEASALSLDKAIPVALDWVNGRRSPDANQELKSSISGLSLATQAPHLFKALVHSICFGSKMIVDRFENEGIKIESVIGVGGVARKSPYIMQTLANVLNMPIKITASDQTPALGAAIYASVVGMIHKDVKTAIEIMGSEFETEYYPQADLVEKNKTYYQQYKNLAQFAEANTKSSSS